MFHLCMGTHPFGQVVILYLNTDKKENPLKTKISSYKKWSNLNPSHLQWSAHISPAQRGQPPTPTCLGLPAASSAARSDDGVPDREPATLPWGRLVKQAGATWLLGYHLHLEHWHQPSRAASTSFWSDPQAQGSRPQQLKQIKYLAQVVINQVLVHSFLFLYVREIMICINLNSIYDIQT